MMRANVSSNYLARIMVEVIFVKIFNIDLNSLIKLIDVLIWPVVVLILAYKFGNEINSLMQKAGLKFSLPGGASVELPPQKQAEGQQEEPVKEEKELKKVVNDPVDKSGKYLLEWHYEKTYRLIFTSQLAILSLAVSNNRITLDAAQAMYSRTKWSTVGYMFNEYMDFMIKFGLLTKDSVNNQDVYKATPLGRGFMEYLKENSIPTVKDPD